MVKQRREQRGEQRGEQRRDPADDLKLALWFISKVGGEGQAQAALAGAVAALQTYRKAAASATTKVA